MEEKEADSSYDGAMLKTRFERRALWEYKWRELTGENGAGHLEVIFELLLHISPTRSILYF